MEILVHSFPIYYDDSHPIEDVVTVAVVLIDAFSGRVITAPVKVSIDGLQALPRRNLTGMRVFVNLPPRPEYRIKVEARMAGYFNPPDTPFPPIPPTGDEPRLDIYLYRRPEFPFDPDTTLVRGRLIRTSGDPVVGGTVTADLPTVPGGTPPFEARTDERGVFALPLRMPENLLPTDLVTFTFEYGGPPRAFDKAVREGVQNTFRAAIRIDGLNEPDLDAFVGDPMP